LAVSTAEDEPGHTQRTTVHPINVVRLFKNCFVDAIGFLEHTVLNRALWHDGNDKENPAVGLASNEGRKPMKKICT